MTTIHELATSHDDAKTKLIARVERILEGLKNEEIVAISLQVILKDGTTQSINASKGREDKMCELLGRSIGISSSEDGKIIEGRQH
jgi:hypothetical protein